MPESIRLGFEEDIEYGLEAAGYDVLPRALYDSVRTEFALEVGGLFDPVTGERHDERVRDVERRTRQRLIAAYAVDAFVLPEIWTVLAPYSGTTAQWHGTTQSVVDPGATLPVALEVAAAVLDVLFCGDDEDPDCEDEEAWGSVAAVSLMVRLENSIGADLYTGWGGIDAVELVNPDTGETYARRGHAYESGARNQEAIVIALSGLERLR